MRNVNYYWRMFATGFCFTSFGVGGLFLSGIIFPLINLSPINKNTSRRIAQRIVHYSFRFFLWEMQTVGVMRINIQGKALLKDGTGHIIIANHPTLIDVILIVAQMKEVDCAVKQEHWKNPFVSGVIKATGYISNSSPEQLLNECVNNINNNRSLIIFPEGTRTTPDEKIRFKRGAAHLAIRCNKNLKPIIISCSPLSLTKGEKWYQVPKEGLMNINITIKEIIQTDSYRAQTKNEPIAARQLTQHLEEYYQKEVLTNDRFSH